MFGCLAPLHLAHLTPNCEALPPWQSWQPMRDEAGSLPAPHLWQRGVVLVLCLPALHGTQADLFTATSSPELHGVHTFLTTSNFSLFLHSLHAVFSALGAEPLGQRLHSLPFVEDRPALSVVRAGSRNGS